MNRINQIWNDLFKYWKKHEPNFTGCKQATDDEIEVLEKEINIPLSNALKQSLKKCNSDHQNFQEIKKSSCLFTGGAGLLHDVLTIKELYFDMQTYMYDSDYPFEYIDQQIVPQNIIWSEKWIPIFNWEGNEWAILDLRPDIDRYGQILYNDPESSILGIWADSYEDFLQNIMNAILDHGSFNNNDIESLRERVYKDVGYPL